MRIETSFLGGMLATSLLATSLLGTLLLTGCPAPTPGQRIEQLGGVVIERGDGIIDLDLSGTKVTDDDFSYLHGFCSNSGKYKAIHTLDLSNTRITDAMLERMSIQSSGFSSAAGLSVLKIEDTAVSDEAVKKFQQSDPDCKIIR